MMWPADEPFIAPGAPGASRPSAPKPGLRSPAFAPATARVRTISKPPDVSAPRSQTVDDDDSLSLRHTDVGAWFGGAALVAAIIAIWMLLELWSGQ